MQRVLIVEDGYITKPFRLAILRARAEAQLRRGSRIAGDSFTQSPFQRMEFFRGEQPMERSKTKQKLLRLLTENRGRTVFRERLLR